MVVVKSIIDNTPAKFIELTTQRLTNVKNPISLYYLKGVTRQANALPEGNAKGVAIRTAKYVSEALGVNVAEMRNTVAANEIRFESVEKLVAEIRKEISLTIAVTAGAHTIADAITNARNFAKIRSNKCLELDLTTHTDVLETYQPF